MLFNSYIFIFLFFPVVLAGYYGLNHLGKYRLATAFLCGMSMWFYGYSNIYYLCLLVVSVSLNYLITVLMEKRKNGTAGRRFLMILGVFLNLGILFYFKYYDFFIENLNAVLRADLPLLNVVLPIGISFFTFQQLSYVVDFYRGECERYSFLEYANYVSFFPQLIAGPIVYHSELIPQFRDTENRKFNPENFSRGLYSFACGLGKKVLIADIFSKIVTIGYGNIEDFSSLSLLLVMVSFTLQLYFDFSAYSDMAYGLGYMLNVVLPINFNSPYKAADFGEFWNRWHITLNRFFVKYLYIPLGGNRKGMFRTCLNVLIVFLVSGFWHGANWTFICWGGINGSAVMLNRIFRKGFKKIPGGLRRAMVFILYMFSLVFFRADSMTVAVTFLRRFFSMQPGGIDLRFSDAFNAMAEMCAIYRMGFGGIIDRVPWLFLMIYLLVVLVMVFFARNTQEKVAGMKFSPKETFVTVFLLVWSIMSLSEISEFLYYNF